MNLLLQNYCGNYRSYIQCPDKLMGSCKKKIWKTKIGYIQNKENEGEVDRSGAYDYGVYMNNWWEGNKKRQDVWNEKVYMNKLCWASTLAPQYVLLWATGFLCVCMWTYLQDNMMTMDWDMTGWRSQPLTQYIDKWKNRCNNVRKK